MKVFGIWVWPEVEGGVCHDGVEEQEAGDGSGIGLSVEPCDGASDGVGDEDYLEILQRCCKFTFCNL